MTFPGRPLMDTLFLGGEDFQLPFWLLDQSCELFNSPTPTTLFDSSCPIAGAARGVAGLPGDSQRQFGDNHKREHL
jgi:hypothetical protein